MRPLLSPPESHMPLFIRTLLLACLLSGSLAAHALPPMLEVDEAAVLLAEEHLQALDIRAPEAYQAGHLPGAISAPYGRWRGPAHNPGQLLDPAAFESLVRELGLTPEQQLLVYATGEDETDFGAAARVYWTLKYLGFQQVSLLNGGYHYWQQQQQVELHANLLPPSQSVVNLQASLAIQTDELLDKISAGQSSVQLLDARPPSFFDGTMKAPTASTGGTIAGARNQPFPQWFRPGETRIRPAAEIRQLVQQQKLTGAEETLSFCNTGHWAATNWFVLSELAGLSNVRLYPGSMTEWTQSPQALPMDNAPTRWQQIQTKFKQLAD